MIEAHKKITHKSILTSMVIFLSRILGFFRDVVMASFWGTSIAMDAFVFAFKIPNLMRSLFGEGALTAGFIPLYVQIREENPQKAALIAGNVITLTAIFLTFITMIAIIITIIIKPFFHSPTAILTLKLLPWFLPYVILICIIALIAGVLNANHSFLLPAAMPCLLNLFFIFCAWLICPLFGATSEEQIFGMTIAILGGGFIQIIILFLKLKKLNINLTASIKPTHETKLAFSKSWRAIIGSGVNQINAVIDSLLAVSIGSGTISALYYSQRLLYLPVGIFAVALASVCLPHMSRCAAKNDLKAISETINFSLRFILFLTVPATIFLIVFNNELIITIFQRGQFTGQSSSDTAFALLFYSLGIPAISSTKILTTAFHGRMNTSTPMRVALFCVVANIILNVTLMQFLKVGGLALASSISSSLNFTILFYILRKDLGNIQIRKLFQTFFIFIFAISIGVIPAFIFLQYWQYSLWGAFFIIIPLCSSIYFFITLKAGCSEPKIIIDKLLRRGNY